MEGRLTPLVGRQRLPPQPCCSNLSLTTRRARGRGASPIGGPAFVVALLVGPLTASAAEDFFARPQPAGALQVQLHPTEVVSPGRPTLVTFGMPFPRGSLTATQLSTVRVLTGDLEVPAFVEPLTPWRHAANPALDGTSVRVARIQVYYTFAVSYPNQETITVQWGTGVRTQSVAKFEDPRTAWHRVPDGTTSTGGLTFAATHDVWEPDVYAVLPKAWLSASGLKTPMLPMGDSVAQSRLNPATVASSYPGYLEADHAQVNFFYTIINDDDPLVGAPTENNTNAFLTDYEAWLYDRGMAMYVGYLRSGYFRFLREAVRNTEFYKTKIYTPADCNNGGCVGSFRMKNPQPSGWQDEKYSYNESLATTYWLTGDPSLLPYIEYIPRVYDGVATAVNPSSFTERHAGFKLLSRVVAYEVTGAARYKSEMLSILNDFRAGQTNSYGGLADGGIWHSIAVHEGDDSNEPITSPWMAAILADAVARAYLVSESPTAAQILVGLANHECGVGSYWTTIRGGENGLADQSGGTPLRFPHYLATRDSFGWASEFNPYTDFEHAFEVASTVAWGAYFAGLKGDAVKQSQLKTCGNELYTTFSHVITYWTRPAAPPLNYDGYRVTPHRKYGWWFKNSSGFQWAMAQAGTQTAGRTPIPTTRFLTDAVDGGRRSRLPPGQPARAGSR